MDHLLSREDGEKNWFGVGGNGSLLNHVTSRQVSDVHMEMERRQSHLDNWSSGENGVGE